MELATIEMPVKQARVAFLEYRRSVQERHNAEDEQIMRGYREMVRGRALIHLGDTIRAGGFALYKSKGRERNLPNLAVMRADRVECWVERNSDGTVLFTPERWYRGRRDRVRVADVIPEGNMTAGHEWGWRALLPLVPPGLRPASKMSNFHILWEADWTYQGRPVAPRDPALLRHIGGELYAVMATWNLTDLERAVLQGRRA